MKTTVLFQRAFILLLVTALIATGLWFTFRRTLIAAVREALIAPDTTDPVTYGATLFQTRGCIGCHTLDRARASGDEGPDLSTITQRATVEEIHESIVNPNAVIASNCPEGACSANVMPSYSDILNAQQVDALVAYLSVTQP
jgi:mono/diheme cytochrome c family protein